MTTNLKQIQAISANVTLGDTEQDLRDKLAEINRLITKESLKHGGCIQCKYLPESSDCETCLACYNYVNWEPMEEE